MKEMNSLLRFSKVLGLCLVLLGIPAMIMGGQGSEMPLLVGLFITLVTRQRIDDERVKAIKMTSVYVAFIISYGIKTVSIESI